MQAGASLMESGCEAVVSLVAALRAPYGLERSIKLSYGTLLTERILVSVHKSALGSDPAGRLLDMAEALSMPAEARAFVMGELPGADIVHLGVEEGGGASTAKLYLEFAGRTRAGLARARQEGRGLVVHRALKWDRGVPGKAIVATYTALPGLAGDAVVARMTALFAGRSDAAPCRTAVHLFNRARGRTAAGDLLFMEVEEEGTSRRSFDLRLYDASLVLGDVAPFAAQLAEHFALSPAAAATLRQSLGGEDVGHVSGGLGRDGGEFLTLYFGGREAQQAQAASPPPARRAVKPVEIADAPGLEWAAPDDRYTDYCLWDYQPIAPTAGKLRSASLLWQALEASGAHPGLAEACRLLRRELGPWRTVWGIKQAEGRLGWEFYFYDYERLERTVSISRVLSALSPLVRCDLEPPEQRPYFMFSIELDGDIVSGAKPLEHIDVYVGNPGSTVSSGICYALGAQGLQLKNFYFFFDAAEEMADIVDKIACSAHLDVPRLNIDEVLWPELVDCKTIVVANKRRNDGIYFSRVRVDQLCHMLERTGFAPHLVGFARAHRDRLDHLLFDVGMDYVMRDGSIHVVKSACYGTF